MGERFDLASRLLGSRMPRRRALWLAAQALLTGAVASQVALSPAAAQPGRQEVPRCPGNRERCGSRCCPTGQRCLGGKCCPSSRVCRGTCCGPNQRCVAGDCCPTGKVCGSVCCQPGFTCQHNQCQQRGGGTGPTTVDEGLPA